MQTRVRDILRTKGFGVFSVSPQDTVFAALEVMAEKEVGAVLVMEGSVLLGVFSEREYARKVILADRSSHKTLVEEIMSTEVFNVGPDATAEWCMRLMTEHFVRYLPVVEEGEVVGVVSIGDAVHAVISSRERKIEQLERYIQGYA